MKAKVREIVLPVLWIGISLRFFRSVNQPQQTGSVPPSERLVFMDGLRGLALLGIFAVNIGAMAAPSMALGEASLWLGPLDQGVSMVRSFFGDGAFIFLFALLFGAGFSVMTGVLGERHSGIGMPAYYRRLCLLGLFGLLHVSLLWWGDVLMIYAIAGACLPLFRRLGSGTLLVWVLLLVFGPLLLWTALLGLLALDPAGYAEAIRTYEVETFEWTVFLVEGYSSNQWTEVVATRWAEFDYNLWSIFLVLPMALGYMLLGLRFAREGRFSLSAEQDRFYRRLFFWTLGPAVLGKGLYIFGIVNNSAWGDASWMIGYGVGGPAMGLLYCCGLRWLYRRALVAWFLRGLEAAGRLALSNYLLQSLLASLLFYGYGLGLYGRVAPPVQMLVVALIFAAQAGLSVACLRRFQKGPLEWVLRCFTYGKV